jgi:hypothetical protein
MGTDASVDYWLRQPPDVSILNFVGHFYVKGIVLKVNKILAKETYLSSAQLNFSPAQHTMGIISANQAERRRWFTPAAQQGQPMAQFEEKYS